MSTVISPPRVTGAMLVGCTEARDLAQAVQATIHGEKDGVSPQDRKVWDQEGSAAPRARNDVLCPEDADFAGLRMTAPLDPFQQSLDRHPTAVSKHSQNQIAEAQVMKQEPIMISPGLVHPITPLQNCSSYRNTNQRVYTIS
ncbi:hypothetical protein NDU88_003591 [Pleurodeles waltl]|uniref:Uncharacterized protein n=1 Tax=Pleurodeles waltl TaxID=8319 RepID=A0AAV7LHH5_PLEWA|nr:hypothetical protein NDU88_003591 [Pleurodeles waltl]